MWQKGQFFLPTEIYSDTENLEELQVSTVTDLKTTDRGFVHLP